MPGVMASGADDAAPIISPTVWCAARHSRPLLDRSALQGYS
jgi:hypothetical protein